MMWTALYVRQRFVDRVAIPFLVLGILQFTELFEAFLYFDSQNTDTPADSQSASRSSAVLIAVALSFCVVAAGQIRNTNENVFRSTGGNKDCCDRNGGNAYRGGHRHRQCHAALRRSQAQ